MDGGPLIHPNLKVVATPGQPVAEHGFYLSRNFAPSLFL
jgi:hypothetical protein